MRKYVLAGSALLIACTAAAQQETAGFTKETHPIAHPVIRFSPLHHFPYHLPSAGPLTHFAEGQRLFTTNIRKAALWGEWQSWFASGQLCDSGRLVQNIPDGEWKFWNQGGQLVALRYYDAEKYQRVIQEIQFYNSRRSFYKLAAIAQENRALALYYLSAQSSFPFATSRPFGTMEELVRSNTSSGSYQPVFSAALHDGLYINYFPGGLARDSGTYKEGLRSGHWVHRDQPGGLTWSGSYQEGKKSRQWKVYNSQGQLKELLEFRKGVLLWRKKYNE